MVILDVLCAVYSGGVRWGGHEISYVSWRLGSVGTYNFYIHNYDNYISIDIL